MKNKIKATNPARATFNQLEDDYPQGDVIITDSYLRLEASIQGTMSNVQFNVLSNQGQANVTERRLNITDLFCATGISYMLLKAGSSTTASQGDIAVAQLRTFPNERIFSGASEAVNLRTIYNGYSVVTIDSVVTLSALDMLRFYRVPTAQDGLAWSSVATTGIVGDDGYENLNYAFCPLSPTIMLNGQGKNEVSVNFAASANVGGTSSQNFLVCIMRGFLLQNAAKYANR